MPLVAIAATAVGATATAPAGLADEVQIGDLEILLDEAVLDDDNARCNSVTTSTLCASGTVMGSSGAPASVPAYDYSCYLDVVVTARRGDTCAMH